MSQSRLEIEGINERKIETLKNDYSKLDNYNANHPDALSDGDERGKGTQHGGHTYSIPNSSLPKTLMNYTDFDINNGGDKYDIEGRNGIGGRNINTQINMYGPNNAYGINSVDTSKNIDEGQVVINYK